MQNFTIDKDKFDDCSTGTRSIVNLYPVSEKETDLLLS